MEEVTMEDIARVFISIGDDPSHPESVISGNTPSDKHILAIGKIIIASTELDTMISDFFSLTMGCEPELAGIIADYLQIRDRCILLHDIFAYRLGSAEKKRAGKNLKQDKELRTLVKLFSNIEEAFNRRNKIVHSLWSADTADDQKIHRIKSGKTKERGWPLNDYSILSVEDILRDVGFIDKVRNDLYLFFWKYFGSWVQERAKNEEGGLRLIQ
jgi:hypothetical protein